MPTTAPIPAKSSGQSALRLFWDEVDVGVEVDFDDGLVAVPVALTVVDVGLVPGQYSVAVDLI